MPAIRWARVPASPAASACRPARPARSPRRTDAARTAPDRSTDSLCPYCGVGCQVRWHVRERAHRVRRRTARSRERVATVRQGPLRLRLRLASGAAHAAAGAPRRACPSPRRCCRRSGSARCSARRPGTRRSTAPPRACCACATRTAARRSRASARPRAATRRRISSRSWCGPACARTTSTTARGCAMRRASRRCWRASVRPPCRTPSATSRTPTSSSSSAPTRRPTIRSPRPGSRTPSAAAPTWSSPTRAASISRGMRGPGSASQPDADVALLQALLHVIVHEGLADPAFVAARTSDSTALRTSVATATPEAMAPVCGVDPAVLRDVARRYATAGAAMILLGHGHLAAHARHRQRALPDRDGAGDGSDRTPRHGAASAARPEQRPGRVGCRADSHVPARLPARDRRRQPWPGSSGSGTLRCPPRPA